jgi:hypothetical protein
MALLGNIIKKGIGLSQKLNTESGNPAEDQLSQLQYLLNEAKDTSFGKYYGFSSILESEDPVKVFRSTVPIFDYENMNKKWWKQQQKYPDITWPGKPTFFALSSGTTGKSSKRIPITSAFLQSMRDVGTSFIRSLPNFDFPDELFQSEVLMLSSSANLSKSKNDHLEGEVSGINVSNFPGWYDLFYRPGKRIASIDNWDDRVEAIAKEAPEWNIGAIAGIPSWVLLLLKKIIDYHKLDTIHDVWPNLTVFASGGVAFETYREDFEQLTKEPLVIMDTYLASEGFFAYTAEPNKMDMRLALKHGYYYEFIPFDERGVDEMGNLLNDPMVCSVDEVEKGVDYVLVVSTCAGAWRYVIGDTIKFTSLKPLEIIISGRTKFFLNVVGSQLSEEKLDDAILKVSAALKITINEYSVAALKNKNGDYIHQWVVVSESDNINELQLKDKLDDALKSANKNYRVARTKALKDIEVTVINKERYYNFLERDKKKGGQVKTPKVMNAEEMEALLNYLNS